MSHNPNNKECHLNHCVGYNGDNQCLGGLDCICPCPPEQKEEWEEEFGADSEWLIPLYTDEVSVEDKKIAVRRLIALAEERGRREGYANRRDDRYEDGKKETITAFVEWAGKQEWLNKGDLLKFADSLKSNLTQKS